MTQKPLGTIGQMRLDLKDIEKRKAQQLASRWAAASSHAEWHGHRWRASTEDNEVVWLKSRSRSPKGHARGKQAKREPSLAE